MSEQDIIQLADKRGMKYDAFCLINFVKERENSRLSIDDILDEYENIQPY